MQMHTADNNNSLLLFAKWFQFEKPSYLYQFIWTAEQPRNDYYSHFLETPRSWYLTGDPRSVKRWKPQWSLGLLLPSLCILSSPFLIPAHPPSYKQQAQKHNQPSKAPGPVTLGQSKSHSDCTCWALMGCFICWKIREQRRQAFKM